MSHINDVIHPSLVCFNRESEQPTLSLFLRGAAVVVGVAAVIIGMLSFYNVSFLSGMGANGSHAMIGVGIAITLCAFVIKCIKEKVLVTDSHLPNEPFEEEGQDPFVEEVEDEGNLSKSKTLISLPKEREWTQFISSNNRIFYTDSNYTRDPTKHLPSEVTAIILNYLSVSDLCRVGLTSKAAHVYVNNNYIFYEKIEKAYGDQRVLLPLRHVVENMYQSHQKQQELMRKEFKISPSVQKNVNLSDVVKYLTSGKVPLHIIEYTNDVRIKDLLLSGLYDKTHMDQSSKEIEPFLKAAYNQSQSPYLLIQLSDKPEDAVFMIRFQETTYSETKEAEEKQKLRVMIIAYPYYETSKTREIGLPFPLLFCWTSGETVLRCIQGEKVSYTIDKVRDIALEYSVWEPQ